MMRDHKPLLRTLPLIFLGLLGADAAISTARTSDASVTRGFTPGKCAVEPPAELLVLSDWPTDGDGCLGDSAESAAMAMESAMAEVVEARIRPVREILTARMQADREQVGNAADAAPGHHLDLDTGANRTGQSPRETAAPAYGDLDAMPGSTAAVAQATARAVPELLAQAGVDEDHLDELRGGFVTPGGLTLSFGIERVVYVNGVLQSTTALRVEDLGRLHGAGPVAVLPSGTTVAVIQNGGGNSVAANALPAATLSTVVQNSLSNQKLQTITTVNATVNSMQTLQGIRLQNSLQDALNRATLMR